MKARAFPNAYLEVDEPSARTGQRWLGGIGFAGTTCFAISLIVLHLMPTGYNPISHPLADYANSRFSAVMTLGTFGGGMGLVGTGFSLHSSRSTHFGVRAGSFLFIMSGAALFTSGLFPAGLDVTTSTLGPIHPSLELVVFALASTGILVVSYAKGARWFAPTGLALVGTATALITNTAFGLNTGGLTDRLMVGVVLSWVLTASYSSFKHPEGFS